jgi:glycosyltransferase involved in cell wall biosynthesis
MICNYNQDWGIERALNSIPKRNDIQIVIVDDGSVDNSDKVIRDYIQNNPIFSYKYIKNETNYGLGIARIIAQSFINGEYFHILDADDWLLTDEFNSIINNYLNNNYDIIYFDTQIKARIPILRGSPNNCKNYTGHNKIFKTQYIIDNNIQWHNIKSGSDLDFDRQWWWRNPNIYFTNILAKFWNKPNDRNDNLSTRKIIKHLNSKNEEQIVRTILSNRNNNEFLKTYNPTFEEVDYKYEVII